MNKGRILIVEDDTELARVLRLYFTAQDYEVFVTHRGQKALEICRKKALNAVLLDIKLPDLNGYEVLRLLRDNIRTGSMPFIFLTQAGERNGDSAPVERSWDRYVTKPFEYADLKTWLEETIDAFRQRGLTHPLTNLPAAPLIGPHVEKLQATAEDWACVTIELIDFEVFTAGWGEPAAHRVLFFLADLICEAVEASGEPDDFIGQLSDSRFIVVAGSDAAGSIAEAVRQQFDAGVKDDDSFTNGSKGRRDNRQAAAEPVPLDDLLMNLTVRVTINDEAWGEEMSAGSETFQAPGEVALPDQTRIFSVEEEVDYLNQLTEQIRLWENAPELAQTLIEVNRVVSHKIHDMSKLGALLDLASDVAIPQKVYANLAWRLQQCRLAYENLNMLRYKIHCYQPFKPAFFIESAADAADWLNKAEALKGPLKESPANPIVAIPKLRLQQIIANICRWLLSNNRTDVEILTQAGGDEVSLIFQFLEPRTISLDAPTLFRALQEGRTGAVYGYLAYKIAVRYGGRIETDNQRIIVKIPTTQADLGGDIERLYERVRDQQSRLAGLEQGLDQPLSLQTLDEATLLIDPLTRDMLSKLEMMLEFLNTNPVIDSQSPPWLTIKQNLRFFRLLVFDLCREQPFNFEPVNLKFLLEDVKTLLAPRIIDHKITIESDIAAPVLVTDKTYLLMIFIYLAMNALEAVTEEGTLSFQITRTKEYFIINVTDDGAGIPPEQLSQVFSPHFTTKGPDRGIGLHSVKRYVERLGGRIEDNPDLEQGASFRISLPA